MGFDPHTLTYLPDMLIKRRSLIFASYCTVDTKASLLKETDPDPEQPSGPRRVTHEQ